MKKNAVLIMILAILLFVAGAIAQAPDTAQPAGEAVVDGSEAPLRLDAEEETVAPAAEESGQLEAPEWANDFVGVNFTFTSIWIAICALLVFIMHLGFTLLETGLVRTKNAVNILFKNVSTLAIGVATYLFVGFNIMYPGDAWIIPGILGFGGFGLPGLAETNAFALPGAVGDAALLLPTSDYPNYTYLTDFLFQSMFAATAVTIVSGAVAERVKLSGYLIFALVYVMFVYPIAGSWFWGGGWLDAMGFVDLAGSTLVHSVGGWAALAGVIVLGPRFGRYIGGKAKAMPGHNLTFATVGMFLLWFGWWGFNGGSQLDSSPKGIIWILVTTNIACVFGIIGSMLTSWFVQKKPDLTMMLNGALAGLVAITACAHVVSVGSAAIVGAVAGVIVVFSVLMFDRLKIDDPVGAISVHLVNGIWGTVATGIFCGPEASVGIQIVGVLAYGALCFPAAFLIFFAVKKTMGLRVSEREEMRGLDIGEHRQEAYSGFQVFTNT